MKASRIGRAAAKFTIGLVLSVLVLSLTVLGLIQTPAGKRLLAEGITALASDLGGGLALKSLTGFVPFRFGIGELRVSDRGGDWLVAEDIRVRLPARELLRLRLRAEAVTVGRITWRRLAVPGDDVDEVKEEGESFAPRDLPSFAVDRLSVRRLIAEEALLGKRTVAALNASLRNDARDGASVDVTLESIEGAAGRLTAAGEAAPDLSSLLLDVRLDEEAGGPLGGWLDPLNPEPLSLRFRGEGPREACRVEMTASSAGGGGIDLDVTLDLERRLAEGTLEASFRHLPAPAISLERASVSARFAAESGRQNVSARLAAAGLAAPSVRAGRIEVTVDADDVLQAPGGAVELTANDLRFFPPDDAGPAGGVGAASMTARVELSDTDLGPRAELSVLIDDYSLPGTLTAPAEPRRLALQAELEDGLLRATLAGGKEDGLSLRGELSAPAVLAFRPFTLRLPEGGAIAGRLAARLDLRLLDWILAPSRQRLRGILNVDLAAGSSPARPEVSGRVELLEGDYQNLAVGTVLRNLSAELEVETGRVQLKRLSASTPGGGGIDLSGSAELSAAEGFPFSLALRLSRARLVNTEALTATFSGEAALEGNREESLLRGTVTVDDARGQIPRSLPPSIPVIDVVEFNKPGGEPVLRPSSPSPFLSGCSLDIAAGSSRGISIKGRGLDSEWRADVTVGGTAAAPSVRGGLFLLQGIFIFMGEELTLRDCSVTLGGEYPPAPQLKVNAEVSRSDIVINLQIVGPLDAPEVILSSQPPYPVDEILARLLYGRSANELTGLQALRIAGGIRSLQGKEGLFDLITGWSSFLGDIQVDLAEMEGGGQSSQDAVRVRWSLSRNFYIESQKAINGSDNLFLARWDLTRRLQLHTRSGYGVLGDSVYLQWQMDY